MAEPVKDSAIRTYLKEKTGLRVEQEPVDLLTKHLTEKCERIAERALAIVQMQERSTLMKADMERAIEEVDSDEDGKPQIPEEIYKVLDAFNVEQLGEVARRIEQSLEQT